MNDHLSEENLHALLDGELDPGVRSQFQAHLNSCTRCQHSLAAVRRVFDQLGRVEELPLMADVSLTVVEQLRARRGQTRGLRRLVLIEVLLAGALLGLMGWSGAGLRALASPEVPALPWLAWLQTAAQSLESAVAQAARAADSLWTQWLSQWASLPLPEVMPGAFWPLLLGLALALALLANGVLLTEGGMRGAAPGNPLTTRNGAKHG